MKKMQQKFRPNLLKKQLALEAKMVKGATSQFFPQIRIRPNTLIF